MNKLKASWQWVVGIVGAIVGLLLLRDFFQKDLKADAKLADTKLKSAVLDEKEAANTKAQEENKNATAGLTDALKAAQAADKDQTPDQVEDFYKKR